MYCYKCNLLNALVLCDEHMPVRTNEVNIYVCRSDGKIIHLAWIKTHPSLEVIITIWPYKHPLACTATQSTCLYGPHNTVTDWHIKQELWVSQKLMPLLWQLCKDLNIYGVHAGISLLHLQAGLWRLSRAVFCVLVFFCNKSKQLCFCWQGVPVPGEEKSCSEEPPSLKKFISL